MGEDSMVPNTDSSGAVATDCHSLLAAGAVAAIVAGVFSATGSLVDAVRGSSSGFSLSTALMLLAIVPEIVTLVAFVRMTQTIDPVGLRSLRRSGVCVFGLGMSLAAGAATTGFFPNAPESATYVALVVVGIGCGTLFGYTFGAGRLSVLFFAYIVVRYLVGYLLLGKRVSPLDAFTIVSFLLLMVSMFAYPVWFANCLRRAKEKLGSPAVLLAAVLMLSLIATVIFCVWLGVIVATTPEVDRMTDDEMEALLSPHARRFNFVGAALELVLGGCVAWLLLSNRLRLIQSQLAVKEST